MKNSSRAFILLLSNIFGPALFFVFALCLCTGCSKSTVSENHALVTAAMPWEPRSFDPFGSVDSASYYAQSLVFDSLVRFDADMKVTG
ncbi:MAG: hypothetical protein K8F91_27220, partial [Candidatus Obscuribacterales bacterium]|nr:hypothetical protein [Candidatus Obscuribacterales bacterium]